MVLITTGNVGKFGAGQCTWAGNYKAGTCTATPWSGAGLGVHTGEDPFNINLDPNAHGKEIKTNQLYYGEEVGYWAHGDTPLIVNTPKYGRKVFTGKTHMPTPSKFRWVVQYESCSTTPSTTMTWSTTWIRTLRSWFTQDVEMTSDVNHNDVAFAC